MYCYQQQQLQIQQQNIHFQNSHHSQIQINDIQNSTRYTNNTQTNHYNTLPVIQHKLPTSNMIEMSPSPSSCSSSLLIFGESSFNVNEDEEVDEFISEKETKVTYAMHWKNKATGEMQTNETIIKDAVLKTIAFIEGY